jgi:Lar family restriction alleviation protein
MSTTFGVKVKGEDEPIEIAIRYFDKRGTLLEWIHPLGKLLPADTEVIPLDNDAQGIDTIGHIKHKIQEQENTILKPCPFCGDKNPKVLDNWGDTFLVRCNTCDAETGDYDNELDARTNWNRRARGT